MQYSAIVTKIIRKYGQVVYPENGAPYRAFVQPLRYQNKLYLAGVRTPLGYDRNTNFLYLGPPDIVLDDGAQLTFAGLRMTAVRCDRVFLKDKPVYTWAVLKHGGDGEEDV